MDISAVDAYSEVEVCTPIFLDEASKSFLNFFKTQLGTFHKKAQHKQELLCGKTFGSRRNVYVIEEPFYFYSTPINVKIMVQQD
jgi:hypothetical protein